MFKLGICGYNGDPNNKNNIVCISIIFLFLFDSPVGLVY